MSMTPLCKSKYCVSIKSKTWPDKTYYEKYSDVIFSLSRFAKILWYCNEPSYNDFKKPHIHLLVHPYSKKWFFSDFVKQHNDFFIRVCLCHDEIGWENYCAPITYGQPLYVKLFQKSKEHECSLLLGCKCMLEENPELCNCL